MPPRDELLARSFWVAFGLAGVVGAYLLGQADGRMEGVTARLEAQPRCVAPPPAPAAVRRARR